MTCWYKQDMGNQGQQAFGGNKNRVLLWSMITTVAENADKYIPSVLTDALLRQEGYKTSSRR